jgi:oxygen-independent coproporphyrinogen III oxidase
MAGVYIHIPFCKQACFYCDFHFSTNQSVKEELIEAIARELSLQKDYLHGEPIETIYFGGGTPSLLTKRDLEIIFNSINKNYSVSESPEVTLEANPDDLNEEKIVALKEAGINRISLGVQSFDNTILKFLNRAHTSEDALASIELLRKHGNNNLSIDLIHSIPGQDDLMLRKNLEKILAIAPAHISVYSLTIEEKTVFGKRASRGFLSPIDEAQSAGQFEIAMDTLVDHGYQHYEISNFCLPGFASKHNSSYWQQKKYLGVGPSAHSFDGESRQFNVSNNHHYIKSIHQGKIPFEMETLSKENKINEYIFTSLRTSRGCSLAFLKSNYGYELDLIRPAYLQSITELGYVTLTNQLLVLTRKGKLLADKIASDLFASVE